MTRRGGFAVLVVVLAGCAREQPPEERHGKPSAAVDVTLAQRPLDAGRYEVTLTATVLRDTPALELAIDGRTEQRGAARTGDVVTTTAIVQIGATGRTIAGGAAVGTGRHRRTKAATIDLGNVPQRRALATRIVVMPNGTLVEEVRP